MATSTETQWVTTHPEQSFATSTDMARNIEVKASIDSLDAVRARLATLTIAPSEVLHQTDTFFAVPHGRLKVREFSDGTGELISYERPDQRGPKESVYMRVGCQNAKALSEILGRALPVRGTVAKRREVFFLGPTRVHLDQVDQLGLFLELEVVLGDSQTAAQGQQLAHELLLALEIPETALIADAYIDLVERLGSAPANHVSPAR